MELQSWATGRFAPVVMVVATPGAEALCQEKNCLSVTDMLRPYATLHNINGAPPLLSAAAAACCCKDEKGEIRKQGRVWFRWAQQHSVSRKLCQAGSGVSAEACLDSITPTSSFQYPKHQLPPWLDLLRNNQRAVTLLFVGATMGKIGEILHVREARRVFSYLCSYYIPSTWRCVRW
jgi:hypothetical protein